MSRELSDGELGELYSWVDKLPLSRPKRHITRDFSDGVMAAEVVKHFFPKLVDLHNYVPAFSRTQKLSNWEVLNRKVFSKLNFHVSEESVKKIVVNSPGVIELVLSELKERIEMKMEHSSENAMGSDYADSGKHYADLHQSGVIHLREEEMKKADVSRQRLNQVQHTLQFHTDVDPVVRLILQEKEQAVSSLQETVEILQLKVSKLEHLLHLKDMRIEELTHLLEAYKARGKKS